MKNLDFRRDKQKRGFCYKVPSRNTWIRRRNRQICSRRHDRTPISIDDAGSRVCVARSAGHGGLWMSSPPSPNRWIPILRVVVLVGLGIFGASSALAQDLPPIPPPIQEQPPIPPPMDDLPPLPRTLPIERDDPIRPPMLRRPIEAEIPETSPTVALPNFFRPVGQFFRTKMEPPLGYTGPVSGCDLFRRVHVRTWAGCLEGGLGGSRRGMRPARHHHDRLPGHHVSPHEHGRH